MLYRLCCMLCLFYPAFVWAEWVQVKGSAPIVGGRYELAREQAREDAFQQAVMQFGMHVKSRQRVENGVLMQDEVSLSSEARVNKSTVDGEYVKRGILYLKMSVDVESVASCPDSQASGYKKKVAILGFTLQTPEQARLGALHDVERGLASAFNRALKRQDSLIVFENSQFSLHKETINAPSQYTVQKTLTNAAEFAKNMGAQFVISGVVRDMSVEDASAFSSSYLAKLKRLGPLANLNRHFSIDMFIHDGFSGAIVWQKNLSVTARWEEDVQEPIGFGSAEFWQGQYGQAVSGLIDGVSGLVSEQLRCQPFMTRISRVEGKTLHFSSGASSGVRPGDQLSVFRTYNFYDAHMLQGMELTNVKTALTVSQVHPGFASGRISVDPGRLNIQEDDLLIAW